MRLISYCYGWILDLAHARSCRNKGMIDDKKMLLDTLSHINGRTSTKTFYF